MSAKNTDQRLRGRLWFNLGLLLLFTTLFLLMINPENHSDEQSNSDVAERRDTRPALESEQENEPHTPFSFAEAEPQLVAENLNSPWAIAVSDHLIYITEREGTIVQIADGELVRQGLSLSREVTQVGEGGLLGMVLDPDFTHNRQAYIYHTYTENNSLYNRVVQIVLDNGSWQETAVLIDRIPGDRIHNGGRLKIGPDEKLYITTGDANVPDWSQDRDNLAGSILRLNLDSSIPEDNPFPGSSVYSYGHRNPQGLAWDATGQLYSSEHGPIGYDEINMIYPGHNYGWPVIVGDQTHPAMEAPLFHSGQNTWAPSGLVYQGGALFSAGLRGEKIRRFDLANQTHDAVLDGLGRLRDLYWDERNGVMYVITNNTDGRGQPSAGDDRLLMFR